MVALPLRLPTASYGGHMGHFLLSMLMLSGSAPFGNSGQPPDGSDGAWGRALAHSNLRGGEAEGVKHRQ